MDRVGKLRVVYWLALANMIVLCIWGAAFDVPGLLGSIGLAGVNTSAIILAVDAFMVVSFLIVAVPIALLIRRPQGWGKLVLPVYGFAWIMHGAVVALMGTTARPPIHVVGLWVPIACGVAMFALAITHQVIDPSFTRSRPV